MRTPSVLRLFAVSCAALAVSIFMIRPSWAAITNTAPTLTQPLNMTVEGGSTADQTITATDPDGDPLTFSLVSGPTFMTVTTVTPGSGTGTGDIHLAPGITEPSGTSSAAVSVTDGTLTDSKPLTITVGQCHGNPTLAQPANMVVEVGTTADQTITGTDACGSPLTFTKVAGPTFMTVTTTSPGTGTGTGNIHLAPGFPDAGSYPATVRVSDGSLSNDKSFTIQAIAVSNNPPTLAQPANMTVNEGATADQTLTATDPDGNPLTFSKVAGPTFMTVSTISPGTGTATGNVHLAPGFADAGVYAATVSVSDGTLPDSKPFTITVNNVNRPPILNQPANMTVCGGSTADQAVSGSDPDGDALTFTKVAGPTYMTVTTTSPTTGNIHLAAGILQPIGTTGATVRASDGAGGTADRSFTITVPACDFPPTLNQPANMTVNEGATADQTITATDPNGAPLTFSKVSGPAFMTVTTTTLGTGTATGNIHLAPGFSDSGTYAATVRASNGGFLNDKTFMITVNDVNQAPVLTQPANMTVSEGATANQALTATDADGNPLSFGKVSGPLFMTVTTTSPGTGTAAGNVHLAPGFADAGTYGATVRVSDGTLSDQKSFAITVINVCSGGPTANAGGPYSGFMNVPVQFDGSGSSDPSGAALTYSWDFGDGSTGTSATPQHTYTVPGTYTVTLSVTGACGTATSSTTALIAQECLTLAFTDGGNKTIRLNSGRPTACVQIEPTNGCYRNEDVILSTVVMRFTGGAVTEIHAISDKTVLDKDTNGDGIAEITACFSKADLRQLFSGLPSGTNTVTVSLEGDLDTGGRFRADLTLRVVSNGSFTAATVSPNPFNPEATLTVTTSRAGFARVELFDVGGRLVRTILDVRSLAPGVHEVKIEGRGARGEPLASGIYFIRGVSPEGEFTKTIAILK